MDQKVSRTSPWVYVGLDYHKRVVVLNKHTSSNADMHKILECCASVFEVDVEDMISPSRKQQFAMARHAFCKIVRERTSETYGSIGKFLSGRDHATIVNSRKKAGDLIDTYPWFKDKYNLCMQLLSKVQTEKQEMILADMSKRVQFVKTITLDEHGDKKRNEQVI